MELLKFKMWLPIILEVVVKTLEETDQKIIEDFFVTEAPSNVDFFRYGTRI